MFGISGYGIAWTQRAKNEGKKPRWNRDLWDRVSCSVNRLLSGLTEPWLTD